MSPNILHYASMLRSGFALSSLVPAPIEFPAHIPSFSALHTQTCQCFRMYHDRGTSNYFNPNSRTWNLPSGPKEIQFPYILHSTFPLSSCCPPPDMPVHVEGSPHPQPPHQAFPLACLGLGRSCSKNPDM